MTIGAEICGLRADIRSEATPATPGGSETGFDADAQHAAAAVAEAGVAVHPEPEVAASAEKCQRKSGQSFGATTIRMTLGKMTFGVLTLGV